MQQQETKISPQALQIHADLTDLINQKIQQQGGQINFAEYMQMALYQPGLGYYQNCLYTLGEQGDFVTAPEISPLFAAGLCQALCSLDKQLTTSLLEIGAGSGQLACDLLTQLAEADRLPENYTILEPSKTLQMQQRQKLCQLDANLYQRVSWLKQLPQDFIGCIFANEVVDAIPCEVIEKTQSGWQYKTVSYQNQQFSWEAGERVELQLLPEVLQSKVHQAEIFPSGYQTEIRPLLNAWLKSLSASLKQGIILLFDYGYSQQEYYHPQRCSGTLKCFSRHTANNNPFALVGLQDITAHVDFSQLAQQANQQGLRPSGFTTQAGFLLENGILEQSAQLAANGLINNSNIQLQRLQQSQQIQKLTAPQQMGELVKVICLSKSTEELPSGFSLADRLHRL